MRIVSIALALAAGACASGNPGSGVPRPAPAARSEAAPDAAVERDANARAAEASAPKDRATDAALADTDPVVARVAGEEVLAGELLAYWLHNRSDEVRGMLDHLVSGKLIALEARRLGVKLDRDDVDLGVLQSIQTIEEEVRSQDPELSFREFVEARLGLDSERYERRLRWEVERKLLGERVVRAFVLAQERVELSVIVTDSRESIDAAAARLEAGEAFAVVARDASVDPSAGFGGRIPPVLRNGTAISDLAFATPPETVGGPLEREGRWLLIRVEQRLDPVAGDWEDVGPLVERSLAERPLEDAEYWQWKSEMQERYRIDLAPFFELVREPAF